jgi:hypothetical protein
MRMGVAQASGFENDQPRNHVNRSGDLSKFPNLNRVFRETNPIAHPSVLACTPFG